MAARIMTYFLRIMATLCGIIAFVGAVSRQELVAMPALIMACLWLLAAKLHDYYRAKRTWPG